jgi:hypothetical protein
MVGPVPSAAGRRISPALAAIRHQGDHEIQSPWYGQRTGSPERWRISVFAKSIACGALPDTPPDTSVDIAQQDLLDYLRRYWNFRGQMELQEGKPDWWTATPTT